NIVGNVTNDGTFAPGNSIGTMTITGNYTHNAGAVYEVEVNALGQSDLLNVTGNATLNGGTVSVLAESGFYFMETNYTILSAGSVSGTFDTVSSNLAFLTPTLDYDPANVYLLLSRNSTDLADAAMTFNQRAVANVLDKATAFAFGDMITVIDNLLILSAPGARDAYDQMGGLCHTALPGTTFFGLNQYMGTVTGRMGGSLANGPTAVETMFPRSFMVASRDDVVSDAGYTLFAALANLRSQEEPHRGLWAKGFGGMGERDSKDISSRYDYDLAGMIVGFDNLVGEDLLLGVSGGYSSTWVSMKDLDESAKVKSYLASIYGAWSSNPWYVNALLAYGFNHYDTSRRIVFGSLDRTAHSDYSGDTVSGQAETGYRFDMRFVDIIPMASLQVSYLNREDFTEKDAGALNLNVDEEETFSVLSALGMKLRKEFDTEYGSVTPELWVRWLHEYSDDAYAVSASFAGAPGSTFTVKSDKPEHDRAAVGFGLCWETLTNVDLILAYDATFSRDTTEQGGAIGMRYRW
ncbi:MAG: autotransporter domain-containing protein, partial [Desulfobacterales bacterium]|nr:autotransporter domain-containing protein [Desulfobacterales bacterium]